MVTIKDIAKMAGVSTATVSRIINGKGEASEETIAKVMQIVKKTNYQPNNLARTLSRKSSEIIAAMVPNLENPFFGELITAIDEETTRLGIQLLICNTNDSREKVEMFLESIANNYAFGAVICTSQVTTDDLSHLQERGIHTVTTDRTILEHPYSAVDVDQKNGAYLATRHLLERGAKRIVFLSGPKEDQLCQDRSIGYLEAIRSADIDFNKILYGGFTLESGYQVMKSYLQKDRTIDGIWAVNDLMAVGAMRACKEYQIRIPEDMRIVGNDNLMIGNYLTPRLTSLSQNRKKVAKAVVDELVSLKGKQSMPKKIIIQPELIVRETT